MTRRTRLSWLAAFAPAVSCLLPASALAGVDGCGATVETDMWIAGSAQMIGADIAVDGCSWGFLKARGGASYYNYNDYNYSGVTVAVRLQANGVVAPFVGAGLIAGVGEQAIAADRDGKDNDNDGIADEPGEEAETRSSLFLYPEAGIVLNFGDSFALTLTGKRYYGDEFSGETIISVGVQTAAP